jgi:hypothetical protein
MALSGTAEAVPFQTIYETGDYPDPFLAIRREHGNDDRPQAFLLRHHNRCVQLFHFCLR